MKGWDSNANKRNRGNQHYRMSELLLHIQIFLLLLLLLFFYVFSLFFSEAWSRNTSKFQHNEIYLYKMKNTRFELMLNFQIMVAADYGFFFVWCSVVVLVYCTNKIEELKDRIIRRKQKIEWHQRVFLQCGGWVAVAAINMN
jgi:hypothetical protein